MTFGSTFYQILRIALLSLMLICLIKSKGFSSDLAPYNVVLIVGDAVRPDYLDCYGGDAKTPHLDWLRKNGVLFERAYTAAPWTSPSSVSLMTGCDATSYRTEHFRETVKVLVPEKELLLLEVLKERGYANRYSIENWNARIHNQLQGAEELNPSLQQAKLASSLDEIEKETGIYQEGLYASTYSFLDFLISVDAKQPFFAIKWFMDPHAPYKPNRKFLDRLKLAGKFGVTPLHYVDLSTSQVLSQTEEMQALINKALYKASIESVDERVGFILKALETKNLLEKTFVIFVSDHGEMFGEHGFREHGGFGKNCTYYEPIVRVPLIMSGPTLPKGKIVSDAVSLVDLMPTIKQLLSLDYEDAMQGKSLVDSIVGEKHAGRPLYFSNIVENKQLDAVIDGDHKLIRFRDGRSVMYNLHTDPGETSDLMQSEPSKSAYLKSLVETRSVENERRRMAQSTNDPGYIPKSKKEEKEIIKQLKSLGYIK